MKKYFLLLPLFLMFTLLLSSCGDDDPLGPDPIATTGNLSISTSPVDGAEIWINGTNTGEVTPATISELNEGQVSVTLILEGYNDTTFTSNVIADQTTPITIELNPEYLTFSNIRLYETIGTTANQPSGLDLSTGSAVGISSADKNNVDIYYSSNGFVITSAANASELTRETYFYIGAESNLNDGEDSPVYSSQGNWVESISDRESNYVFLYTADGNYAKIKITSFGGGTPGAPAWVEISGTYNKGNGSTQF